MFNKRNATEMRVVRVLGHSEGIISREQFLQLSNRTMLSRYINNGLLAQVKNAEKGVYQITPKFKSTFRKEIEPRHQFSGSGSLKHSAGLITAISLLPQKSELTTGQAIKKDFDRYRKTVQCQMALSKIQERNLQKLEETRAQIETIAQQNKACATYLLNQATSSYKLSLDEHKAFSTPDIKATMTLEDLRGFRENLIEYSRTHELSVRKDYLLKQTVSKLNQMERNYYNSGPVSLCIEIVTGSYGNVEIEQKENWAEATGSDLVFLSF